jgi:hypothetical protein
MTKQNENSVRRTVQMCHYCVANVNSSANCRAQDRKELKALLYSATLWGSFLLSIIVTVINTFLGAASPEDRTSFSFPP